MHLAGRLFRHARLRAIAAPAGQGNSAGGPGARPGMPIGDASWLSHHCAGSGSIYPLETILVQLPKTGICVRDVLASGTQGAGTARDRRAGSCLSKGERHRMLHVLSLCQTACLYPFANQSALHPGSGPTQEPLPIDLYVSRDPGAISRLRTAGAVPQERQWSLTRQVCLHLQIPPCRQRPGARAFRLFQLMDSAMRATFRPAKPYAIRELSVRRLRDL